MIFEWVPSANTIGILYCTNESNSKYQSDMITEEIKKINASVNIDVITFSDTNELTMNLQAKVSSLDVLYIPTDNTCADNAESINSICSGKLPVIAGEEGICRKCGLATLSIDYYHLGEITGEMAVEILLNGKKPSELPIRYDEELTGYYNTDVLAALGISPSAIPEGYQAL